MQTENLCRCCLSEGILKDFNSPYKWFDKEEIYSNMLNDCFRINLHYSKSSKICEICIKDLRVSLRFKEQVLKAEEEFLRRINQEQDKKPLQIKLEAQENIHDESEGYFTGDADEKPLKIKLEAQAIHNESEDYFTGDVDKKPLKVELEVQADIHDESYDCFTRDTDEKSLVIELEAQADIHDESYDYFTRDTVEDVPMDTTKEKVECNIVKRLEQQRVENNIKLVTGTTGNWENEKLKSVVTRLNNMNMVKSRAEYMRNYRQKKREEKLKTGKLKPKKIAKSSTQRTRDWRARAANSILSQTPTADPTIVLPNLFVSHATGRLSSLPFCPTPSTSTAITYNTSSTEIHPHPADVEQEKGGWRRC